MITLFICFSVFSWSVNGDVNYENWDVDDYALFPTLPIAAPYSDDEKCRNESRALMIGLKNGTYWAMKMWDSSAKTEFGMLYGNVYQGGNFDECLSVKQPIKSQYCGVSIRANVNQSFANGDPFDVDPDPISSVWKKLKDSRLDRSKYPRDNATWGLCVPESCTRYDLEKSIRSHLAKINAKRNRTAEYVARIGIGHCQKQQVLEFKPAEIAFWFVAGFFLLLVIAATSFDLFEGKSDSESKAKKLVTSFSLNRNFRRMIAPDQKDMKELQILYLGKIFTIAFIIFAHRCGLFFSAPIVNYQYYEESLRKFHRFFLPHGDLLVDSFFFISGLLVCSLLSELYEKKFVNPLLIIFGRFIRLAPLYYFMVWFHTSALYRFGSGPVWIALKPEVENCEKNWWTNLLFVNNYINVEQSCMIHTWFIPCDFHLFIVGVFLVILINRKEKLGLFLSVVLFLISTLIPGFITYYNRLIPLHLFYHENLGANIRFGLVWKLLYIPTHARAAVYFMGFITGFIIRKSRNSPKKLPMFWACFFILVSFLLIITPMIYGGLYYDPRRPYSLLESSIFASLRRIVWGFGCFVFLMVNTFTRIKFFDFMSELPLSIALGKSTYAIYLVHFYMISADRASLRIPDYFSIYNMFATGCSDLLIAASYGVALYLFVELPFKVLVHELLFAKRVKKALKEIEENKNRPRSGRDIYRDGKFRPPNVLNVKL